MEKTMQEPYVTVTAEEWDSSRKWTENYWKMCVSSHNKMTRRIIHDSKGNNKVECLLQNGHLILQGSCVKATQEKWDSSIAIINNKWTKKCVTKKKTVKQKTKGLGQCKTRELAKTKLTEFQKFLAKQFFESYKDCQEFRSFSIRKDSYQANTRTPLSGIRGLSGFNTGVF